MKNVEITFPNNEKRTYEFNTSYYDIAKDVKEDLKNVIAVSVNNETFSLDMTAKKNETIKFLDVTSLQGYKIYQSGLKFIFQVAVSHLYKDAQVSFLHSVPRGILCEIQTTHNLTYEDISKIKGEMTSIVEKNERIYKYRVDTVDASNYFKKINENEKSEILDSLFNEVTIIYKLEDKINYFYTLMPYETGVINKFELVFLGRNRVVLVCPNIVSKDSVPEYVHYENIVNNFLESKKWLKKMNMVYLADLNNVISEGHVKDFIESSEFSFGLDLFVVSEKILMQKDLKMVLIAGPSSSGKTTTMKRLAQILNSRGCKTITLSTDDFFVNRDDTPRKENGEFDFECLEAIDLELFNNTLKKLINHEEVELPTYEFTSGKRLYLGKKAKLEENGIILIEGLHTLNDDLTPQIDNKYKFKIYLSPFMALNLDRHNYISTLDLRLIRRIVRDFKTRGRSLDQTFDSWQGVREGEEKYIFPYIYQADVIINTAMAYEVGALKLYAEPILFSIDHNSKYYNESKRLISVLKPFFIVPSEYIPKFTIIREFIDD